MNKTDDRQRVRATSIMSMINLLSSYFGIFGSRLRICNEENGIKKLGIKEIFQKIQKHHL